MNHVQATTQLRSAEQAGRSDGELLRNSPPKSQPTYVCARLASGLLFTHTGHLRRRKHVAIEEAMFVLVKEGQGAGSAHGIPLAKLLRTRHQTGRTHMFAYGSLVGCSLRIWALNPPEACRYRGSHVR